MGEDFQDKSSKLETGEEPKKAHAFTMCVFSLLDIHFVHDAMYSICLWFLPRAYYSTSTGQFVASHHDVESFMALAGLQATADVTGLVSGQTSPGQAWYKLQPV